MVITYSLEKTRQEGETNLEFCQRLCSIKSTLGMTWKDLADHINHELGQQYSDSWYRKNYQAGNFLAPLSSETTSTKGALECFDLEDETDLIDYQTKDLDNKELSIQAKLHNLAMKKVEVSDLIIQNNAYIRRLSREQTIKDIAHEYAKTMSEKKILSLHTIDELCTASEREGVLLLSDWHYGMVCDNPWNKFDPDICEERVNKLLSKTIQIIKNNNIGRLHVLDLADLIAGRIHTQIRIESRFDVITQTMQVAEILAEFLDELTYYCPVSFYSCLDNHSRLEPNKKESMDLESLARLIPWYLKERLASNCCVDICENKFGADIITCNVAGHNVIGVHGDNDNPTTALERLSLLTHQHYDMLCTAHRHHFSMDEQHQSLVVSNSSLMGVDRYAEKLRLSSDPSQTFVVSSKENVCECVYRITLN